MQRQSKLKSSSKSKTVVKKNPIRARTPKKTIQQTSRRVVSSHRSQSHLLTQLPTVPNTNTTSVSPVKTIKRQYSFEATPEYDTVLHYKFVSQRKVSVVGVPFAFGQPLQGVDKAPEYMRLGGLLDKIKAEQWQVEDHGDIPVDTKNPSSDIAETRTVPDGKTPCLKSADIVSKVCHDTALVTAKHTKNGDFMLTVGGDHSIAMGSIAGVLKSRPNAGIVWVDAHADINTPLTTPSGNVHGMPVSFLMKHPDSINSSPVFKWLEDYPALDPRKIVYIGLRDLEQGERRIIKQFGIKAFTMQDVDRHGIGSIMDKAIRHLTNDRRLDVPIHLSMDIDGVDPLFAPSTGTRVFGGLSYREAYFICESLAESGLLASMDLVEVNPALGESEEAAQRTVKIANGLVGAALGNRIL